MTYIAAGARTSFVLLMPTLSPLSAVVRIMSLMIRANVIGILIMCDIAQQKNVHVSNFVLGCFDKDHTEDTLNDKPRKDVLNCCGSFYPEMMLRCYAHVLQFGVHMLLDSDLQNPCNLITKISNYPKVCHIPKSFTVLEESFPMAIDEALRGLIGSYNWTNTGVISHNEILELYRDYLHPEFTWQNYTEEEEAELMRKSYA